MQALQFIVREKGTSKQREGEGGALIGRLSDRRTGRKTQRNGDGKIKKLFTGSRKNQKRPTSPKGV